MFLVARTFRWPGNAGLEISKRECSQCLDQLTKMMAPAMVVAQNIHRQVVFAAMKPPAMGPRAGPRTGARE